MRPAATRVKAKPLAPYAIAGVRSVAVAPETATCQSRPSTLTVIAVTSSSAGTAPPTGSPPSEMLMVSGVWSCRSTSLTRSVPETLVASTPAISPPPGCPTGS